MANTFIVTTLSVSYCCLAHSMVKHYRYLQYEKHTLIYFVVVKQQKKFKGVNYTEEQRISSKNLALPDIMLGNKIKSIPYTFTEL